MSIVARPASTTPSELARLGWHGSAVVAGSRRARAGLVADLASCGRDLAATSAVPQELAVAPLLDLRHGALALALGGVVLPEAHVEALGTS